jgi:hypothetical protein
MPRISATDSLTCHSLRCDVDAERGLPGKFRAFQRFGQPFGVVDVSGQFDQQLPRAVDGCADAEVLGRQRACPCIDQLECGDAVGVAQSAGDFEQRAKVCEPRDGRHPMRGRGMQAQVERRDHAEGAFGPDEQGRQVVTGVVAPHVAVTLHHRTVGQCDVESEHLLAHVPVAHRAQPACIRRRHAADRRAVAGGEIDAEHQACLDSGLLHRCRGGSCSDPHASFDDVDGAELGQPFGGQQHVIVFGHGPRHQRRPAALDGHVRACATARREHGGHLVGGARPHQGGRRAPIPSGVVDAATGQHVGICAHVASADDRRQPVGQRVTHSVGPSQALSDRNAPSSMSRSGVDGR